MDDENSIVETDDFDVHGQKYRIETWRWSSNDRAGESVHMYALSPYKSVASYDSGVGDVHVRSPVPVRAMKRFMEHVDRA